MDHAWCREVGREVRQRSDDAPRLDGRRDHAARIDTLEPETVELAAEILEVPPGDPVLRADDDRVRPEERGERGRNRREAVRLHAEKDDVGVTDGRDVRRQLRPHLEVAVGAAHLQAAVLHRAQVRSARDQHDVGADTRQLRADVPADRAGSDDDDLHEALGAKACATIRRWILPVAVRGIVSVM